MLQKTNGIVLRAIKYGDTSLVVNIFTEKHGVQAYMVQGVRSSNARQHRAGLFQPGMMLDMVVYLQPQKNLQRIREYHVAYHYTSMQEDVVKNSVALFSLELLLRLLPEQAPLPSLYSMASEYFRMLDTAPANAIANFPLYFIIQCSRELGYELKGEYTGDTPYLDMREGGFIDQLPANTHAVTNEDARILGLLLAADGLESVVNIEMNGAMRWRLIDWFITFLQQHTQHMGHIRSLPVLHTILH